MLFNPEDNFTFLFISSSVFYKNNSQILYLKFLITYFELYYISSYTI